MVQNNFFTYNSMGADAQAVVVRVGPVELTRIDHNPAFHIKFDTPIVSLDKGKAFVVAMVHPHQGDEFLATSDKNILQLLHSFIIFQGKDIKSVDFLYASELGNTKRDLNLPE